MRDARQQALLLLFGAEIDQRLDGVEIGRPNDAGCGAGGRDFLNAGEIRQIGQPRPLIRLWDEHRVQPQRVDGVHIFPGKLARRIVMGGARGDLVARQGTHAGQQHRLRFGQIELVVQAGKDGHKSVLSEQCPARRRGRSSRRSGRGGFRRTDSRSAAPPDPAAPGHPWECARPGSCGSFRKRGIRC